MIDEAPIGRPSERALWRSLDRTLRDVVLPEIVDPHVRGVVAQLVGLARYACERGNDPSAQRVAEIRTALDELIGNSLLRAVWPPTDALELASEAFTVMTAASTALAACVDRPDDDEESRRVRAGLRPVVLAHLDQDLTGNAVLMAPFRGRLPGA